MPELNAITVYTKFFTPSYFYFKMGGNAPGLSAVRLDWLVLKAILFLYSTFLSMKPGRIAESPCYQLAFTSTRIVKYCRNLYYLSSSSFL